MSAKKTKSRSLAAKPARPSPDKKPHQVTLTNDLIEKYGPMLKQPGILNHSTGRLLAIVRKKGEALPSKDEEDFALEAFIGFVPNGPGEILLVQQMIGSYEMAMEMLTRSKQAEYMPQMEQYGSLAAKMMNVYLAQFQALMKSRKPQQIVEVQHTHRHVHLNGQVTPGQGVVTQIERQPHETIDPRTLALAPGPALLGQDPTRDCLPIATDKARPVSVARGRVRHRRSQGA
jgi:hypothetical protein